MIRVCSINLDEILNLILASEDFGFSDDVFLSTMSEWSGYVTNKEIEDFAVDLVNNYDYTEIDKHRVISSLKDWRNQFCKKKNRIPR